MLAELGIVNKDFHNRNVIELHDVNYYARMVNCINDAFTKYGLAS